MPRRPDLDLNTVLSQMVDDVEKNGYDSVDRLNYWKTRLRRAAVASMTSSDKVEAMFRAAMVRVYKRQVDHGGALKYNPGAGRFGLGRLRPALHSVLDRTIHAGIDLIKLNRSKAIERMTQAYSGWMTSVPKGGSGGINRREVKEDIKKGIAGLSFEERRVMIDQGHKLNAAINRTVAEGSGALGAVWRSHWRQANYDYREEHRERDGKFYVLRDNWAMQQGLMKAAGHTFTDEITQPGEEVFCKCNYEYVYGLRNLPDECLTEKGKRRLEEAREAMKRDQ